MISAVIAVHDAEADLVAALSPLVPASMEGLVRELVIADAGSTDASLEIAEEAGALVVRGGEREGCSAARGPWLLVLSPTSRLYSTWPSMARAHIERNPGRAARLTKPGLFAKTEALLVLKADYGRARRPVRVVM